MRFVIPEWGMVIRRPGLDQNDGKISGTALGVFIAKVGEAVVAPSAASATKAEPD